MSDLRSLGLLFIVNYHEYVVNIFTVAVVELSSNNTGENNNTKTVDVYAVPMKGTKHTETTRQTQRETYENIGEKYLSYIC